MIAHSAWTPGSAAMEVICDSNARARRRLAYSCNATITSRFQLSRSSVGARADSSSTRVPGSATLRRIILSLVELFILGTLYVTHNSTPLPLDELAPSSHWAP